MSKSFYVEQLERKRPWAVPKGSSSLLMPGAEKTIAKALELRVLELDVKGWLDAACKREKVNLSQDMLNTLHSNMEDEIRHDEGLSYCAGIYNIAQFGLAGEAESIRNAWLCESDHPIATVATLEMSVFFIILPILRFLSGTGGCLRTLSADISGDEAVHAATHRQMCKDLGITVSPSLNRLRRETVAWLVSDLDVPGKWGNKNMWMKSSDSLFERGVAPGLAQTASYSQPAFFEIRNDNLPSYG